MKLKEKHYQVTTLAGKEDATNSTATTTTTTFTSSCDLKWDSCDVMMEPRTLSEHSYLRVWKKKIGETCPQVENNCTPSLQKRNDPHSNLTQQAIFRHGQLREFYLCSGVRHKEQQRQRAHCLQCRKIVKSPTSFWSPCKSRKEARLLVRIWKIQGKYICTKKTQETSGTGGTARRHRTEETQDKPKDYKLIWDAQPRT